MTPVMFKMSLLKYNRKHSTRWFCQKVLWNWYNQNDRVLDGQHISYVWWTFFSTDSLHSHGYKMCILFSSTNSFIRMMQTSYRDF